MAHFIAPGRDSPGYNAGMSEQDPPPGFGPANFSPGFLERGGPYWLSKASGSIGCGGKTVATMSGVFSVLRKT